MTKTDWTAEEVRNQALLCAMSFPTIAAMLDAFAERIEADDFSSHTHDGKSVECVPNPPAQPTQLDCAVCGCVAYTNCLCVDLKPHTPTTAPAQEQPGWKWVPVEPTDEMITVGNSAADVAGVALNRNFLSAVYQAMTLASPTPPKEK